MNTLKIEALLAKKYKYKPLPEDLSVKYRKFFLENIPEWLCVNGGAIPLYTVNGIKICDQYERIVIGDYGAFVEFREGSSDTFFQIKPGQEYRVFDEKYMYTVKYIWLTIDDGSGIKIYKQRHGVSYADYRPGMFYVSVHEVFEGKNGIGTA